MFPPLEKLHHANLVTGNRAKNLERVKAYAIEQGIQWQGNPDVLVFDDEQILMAQAEQIVSSVVGKKVGRARMVVISADRMAADVQNRLLKTLEEPQEGTYFFVLVLSTERILPTILSRCQVFEGDVSESETRMNVRDFMKASLPERFALVESVTKAKKDEDNVSKAEVLAFIDQLEKVLWESGSRDEQLFADLRKMKGYAAIRGASHRVILDFLAMVAPQA